MAVFNGVFPIQAGKEEDARAFAAETFGSRRPDFEAHLARAGVTRETWSLQATPMGTLMLVWFEGEACICMDEMQVDFITSRMKVKRTMMFDDGRTREIDYQIRIYSLHELGKLLHDHGFRVAEVSGNCATPGVFFGTASPRTLILAEKR